MKTAIIITLLLTAACGSNNNSQNAADIDNTVVYPQGANLVTCDFIAAGQKGHEYAADNANGVFQPRCYGQGCALTAWHVHGEYVDAQTTYNQTVDAFIDIDSNNVPWVDFENSANGGSSGACEGYIVLNAIGQTAQLALDANGLTLRISNPNGNVLVFNESTPVSHQ